MPLHQIVGVHLRLRHQCYFRPFRRQFRINPERNLQQLEAGGNSRPQIGAEAGESQRGQDEAQGELQGFGGILRGEDIGI